MGARLVSNCLSLSLSAADAERAVPETLDGMVDVCGEEGGGYGCDYSRRERAFGTGRVWQGEASCLCQQEDGAPTRSGSSTSSFPSRAHTQSLQGQHHTHPKRVRGRQEHPYAPLLEKKLFAPSNHRTMLAQKAMRAAAPARPMPLGACLVPQYRLAWVAPRNRRGLALKNNAMIAHTHPSPLLLSFSPPKTTGLGARLAVRAQRKNVEQVRL